MYHEWHTGFYYNSCRCRCSLVVQALWRKMAYRARHAANLAVTGTQQARRQWGFQHPVPDAKPEPYRMSVIFNFTTRTVQGINSPAFPELNYPIKITGADDVAVAFRGSGQVLQEGVASTEGTIDRITGDLEFTETLSDPKDGKVISQTNYALKCRPAQRMF
jgi:hypothetical protein